MPNKFDFTPPTVFQDGSYYPDPQNEQETREQLSTPLFQLRDFINNYLLTLNNGSVVSLRVSGNLIEYSIDGETWFKTGTILKDENQTFLIKNYMKFLGFVLSQTDNEIVILNKFRLNGKMIESTSDGVTWQKTGQIVVDSNGNELPIRDRLQFLNANVTFDGGKVIVDAKGQKGDQGVQGPTGPGVAPGGVQGQYLAKKTDDDYDTEWKTIPNVIDDSQSSENTTYSSFEIDTKLNDKANSSDVTSLTQVREITLSNTTATTFNVSVSGITANDSPELYAKTINLSTLKEKQAVQEEFNKIVEATTGDNSITFILSEPLSKSIVVYVKGK